MDILKPQDGQRSETDWREVIRAQIESGLSQFDFCEQNGFSYWSFQYHIRSLRSELLATAPNKKGLEAMAPSGKRLRLVSAQASNASHEKARDEPYDQKGLPFPSSQASLRLLFRDCVLEIPKDADACQLKGVISILREVI